MADASGAMKSFRLKSEIRKSDRLIGCGCLIGIGLILTAVMIGAMMGDYIGPPEGAEANRREADLRVALSFAGLVAAGWAGVALIRKK